jgi:hypothetical protein
VAYTYRHGSRPLEGVTVQRAVGRGGFGEVYYAVTDSGKQIALKYLRENPEIELRGIGHVINLKSPHLITIYDVKHGPAGEPFVLMEYVSGPSLRELLVAEPNGLGPQKAAYFLDGVAKGLAYLHDRGIVHRDLKPANIFYDDGYVKIGDYGLSKHIAVSRHSGQTVSVGTVHYMAPEIGSGSYTKAIDIYALGVILYEMLTGRLPFTGSSMGEILMRHLSDRPDLSGIPAPFAAVIAKALAKDPADRYADASAMADALRQLGDISDSIASFDPSTLNDVPRRPEADDAERTLTTSPAPPAPPPPMDAWAAGRSAGHGDLLAARLQRKVDKLSGRFRQKAERLGRVHGWAGRHALPEFGGATARGRRRQAFMLVAVIIAVAIGLGVIGGGANEGQRAAALGLCMAAGTFGPLLTYFRFLRASPARGGLWDRIAYTGMTAVFMIPAFAVASDLSAVGDPLTRMLLAPLAAVLLCDWTARIEVGRRGEVRGGQAVAPAIIGLVAASFAGQGSYGLTAACVCAMMSLLTQAGAAMWPYARGAQQTGPVGPGAWAGGPSARPAHGLAASGAPFSGEYQYPGRDSAGAGSSSTPRRRSGWLRAVWGVLAGLVFAGGLSALLVLTIDPPARRDDCAGLLFAALASVAWLPFVLTMALRRYVQPLWRGTLRMLTVSLGLTLSAGMVALLAFGSLRGDEFGGVIFGLIAGGLTAVVALCVPGRRWPGTGWSACGSAPAFCGTPVAPEPSSGNGIDWVSPAGGVPDGAVRPAPAGPVVIDAAAPSFVGRTANAGASFFGKLLLLIGVALAFAYDALQAQIVTGADGRFPGLVSRSGDLPESALLALPLVGSLLLVLARRREGHWHLLRGCLGCGLVVLVVVLALGPAAEALYALFSAARWSELDWGRVGAPLAWTGTLLLLGLVLLIWPKRGDGAIVV